MADNKQVKSEAALLKKVWDIANVLAAAGVGFTDYITQLTYVLFLKMDEEKEELGLGSSIPEGYKWKDLADLNGESVVSKTDNVRYVLEVKQGWFKKNNITEGTLITTAKGTMLQVFPMY